MSLTLEASKQITSTGTAHSPIRYRKTAQRQTRCTAHTPPQKKLAGLTVPALAPAIHALRPLTKPGINTPAQLVLNGNTKNQQAFNKGKGYADNLDTSEWLKLPCQCFLKIWFGWPSGFCQTSPVP
ncbi:hypothetical protein [Methylovulum miyakonense]|uniref:hypothetical protein n=1 Tax=Methylovulum miyakonense TaxID=645578 RepID=UPI00037C81A6|nr:hypothetical protein [Methylovulum miyakonense]